MPSFKIPVKRLHSVGAGFVIILSVHEAEVTVTLVGFVIKGMQLCSKLLSTNSFVLRLVGEDQY